MTTLPLRITAGVDTHLDVHVAAALDDTGGLLGVESFATTTAGYRRLLAWLRGLGELELVGIEGTGSYGAGLTRLLLGESVRVVEIDRPNRQRRRRRGKSDPQDAITAARAAQSGDACGEAKTRDGNVEAMRVLRVARFSARKARTQTLNQMRSLISTGPESIRAELRHLKAGPMLDCASAYRPGTKQDLVSITKFSLRLLARRAIALEAEVAELDALLTPVGRPDRTRVARGHGAWHRHRVGAARGGGRQPRTPPQRSHLRPSLRRVAARCEQRQERAAPTQSRR